MVSIPLFMNLANKSAIDDNIFKY